MANPETFKVTFDEDVQLSEDEIRGELAHEVSNIQGVEEVEVESVNTARPYVVVIEVLFDETVTKSATVELSISSLDFVHNAQATR